MAATQASSPRRLLVARFSHEGNSFGPLPADRAAFERREWQRGPQVPARMAGTSHELAALQPFAQAHPDWELVVSRCAAAMPSGPIDDALFDAFLAELLADLDAAQAAGGLAGIYLSLHGAAITPTRLHPDLDLLEAIRARCPQVPLAATFDLHANLHPRLASLLAIGGGYRTHPHVDMAEVATRALEGLVQLVERGGATRCAVEQTGLLLSSVNMRTAQGPMRELQEVAREAERQPGVLAASVFGGFPYADTPHTGASTLVFTDAGVDPDGRLAREVAQALAGRVRALAPEFEVRLPTPEAAIAQALARTEPGLVAITDPADNPYSGGAADTPALLRALLASRASTAVLACLCDPDVVAQARAAGVGQAYDARLGARWSSAFGEPVPVRVVPLRFTDGRYVRRSPKLRGTHVCCGETVLLAVEGRPGLRIIVTEQVDGADDPAFYDLHGLQMEQERLLLVKGKNHMRAGIGAVCAAIIDTDAPGPACLDLRQLPYRHLRP